MNSILIIALIACSLDLSQSQYNFQYENSVYSNNEIETGSSNWLGFSNNNWFQYGSTNRRSEAKIEACGSRSCKVRECSSSRFDSGWNIRGSDYGCCGNYEGCCTFASDACYTHDHQCRCCDLSWYCLSGCVPDPSC